jgi:general secretion pathway protein M
MKLNKREKYSIYAVSGLICFIVLIQFIISPFIEKRKRITRAIPVKSGQLEEIQLLKSKYDAMNRGAELARVQFSKREKDFTLFSFLDKLSDKAGIKNNINYMKPSTSVDKNTGYKTSIVAMKLQAITLKELTSFMYMVETSKNIVYITRLSISKTGKKKPFINALLQVETSEI